MTKLTENIKNISYLQNMISPEKIQTKIAITGTRDLK